MNKDGAININLKVYTDILTGEVKYAVVYNTMEEAMVHIIRAASQIPPKDAPYKPHRKRSEKVPISKYITEILQGSVMDAEELAVRGNKKYGLNYSTSIWAVCASRLAKKGILRSTKNERGKMSYWSPKEE